MKSKSRKSMKSSRNEKNSSLLSSINFNLNNYANKSKSSSFSRKFPILSHTLKSVTRTHKSFMNRSRESSKQEPLFPNIYFSLHDLCDKMNEYPSDSPRSMNRKSVHSFKNEDAHHRMTTTIKRNLILYNSSKKKMTIKNKNNEEESGFFSFRFNPDADKKLFSNHQNQIFNDLTFFEEGLKGKLKTQKKNKRKRKNAIIVKNNSPDNLIKNMGPVKKNKLLFSVWFQFFKKEFNFIIDFSVLLLILIIYIWIPIEIAFKSSSSALFSFSIFTIFFSIFRENKDSDKKTVFSQKFFSITSMSLFCFLNFGYYLDLVWALFFLLLQSSMIFSTHSSIHRRIQLNSNLHRSFSFFIIIFRFFSLANFLACVWIYLGNAQANYSQNAHSASWLSALLQEEISSQFKLYIRCLNSSLSNLTLVGIGFSEGLIKPITEAEHVYSCVISIIGIFFMGVNWSSFQSLIKENTKKEDDSSFKEFERVLEEYGLDYKERTFYMKELHTVLDKNKDQKVFGELLQMMSPSYQESFLMRIYWPIVKRIPVLARNFSKEFLIKLLKKIKIINFTPNEILFEVLNNFFNNFLVFL